MTTQVILASPFTVEIIGWVNSSKKLFRAMYLNLIQIAESFGVSEKTVEGWIRDESMPYTRDRERLLFDRSQVAEWATRRGLAGQAGFLTPEKSILKTTVRLGPLLRIGGIWRDIPSAEVTNVFERIVTGLPGATPAVCALLGQRLRAKGGVTIAPVGDGFALPHPSARITLGRDSGTLALLLLRDGLPAVEAGAYREPVTRMLFFIAPSPRAHLDMIGQLSRWLRQGTLRELIAREATDQEIFEALDAMDAGLTNGSKAEVKS